MSDINKYKDLRDRGATALEVYTVLKADGVRPDEELRILYELFNIGFEEYKDLFLAYYAPSISREEHERNVVSAVIEVLNTDSQEHPDSNR